MPGLMERGIDMAYLEGRCQRVNIRTGFDITLYDVAFAEAHTAHGHSEPGLTLTALLEAGGSGSMVDVGAIGGSPEIQYKPGVLYVCYSIRPVHGSYTMPAGCHFLCAELRLTPDFLERVGFGPLFASADTTHPLHHMSANGVWIGTVEMLHAMQERTSALIDCGLGTGQSDLTLETRALELLMEAARLMDAVPSPRRRKVGDERRLDEARDIVLSDVSQTWTIAQLARKTGLNEKKLKAGFKARFGCSVRRFIQRARLTTAREMLYDGECSVTEAAFAVGYSNPSYFAELYRREYGLNPSEAAQHSP
jgi:AraC-like DNA-binding protein